MYPTPSPRHPPGSDRPWSGGRTSAARGARRPVGNEGTATGMTDNEATTPGSGSTAMDGPNIVSPRTPESDVPARRGCGAMLVHRRLLNASAAYRDARSAIENATLGFLAAGGAPSFEGVTRIPVVV